MEFYQTIVGNRPTFLLIAKKGLLRTEGPICWFHWNANDAKAFAEGKIVFLQHKGANAANPFQASSSAYSQRVTERTQFSPFTPILLRLTVRTTGSDIDEFAKSKENN